MFKAKRVLALAAALMMCGTTAACGESGNTGDTSGGNDGAKTKLVFWNGSYKTVDDTGVIATEDLIFNKTIEEFEKANNCEIEVVDQTADNLYTLFRSAGVAKNGPDIAFLWAGGYTNDYRDFIEPLDSYFTEEELAEFPNLDLCRAEFKPDGALLGIPTDVTTVNLFYNKDAFEKAGLPRDAHFETIDELKDACAKLSDAGITPFAMIDGNGYASAWNVGAAAATLYGPEGIFDLLPGNEDLSGEKFTKAVTEWVEFGKEIVENGWANEDWLTTTAEDVFMPLYTGESAMRFGGSWDCGNLYNELGDSVGTMALPCYNTSDEYAEYIVGQIANNLVVTNYSKNKQLAVDFIKACTTEDFYLQRYEQEGQLPGKVNIDMSAVDGVNPLLADCYALFSENKNVIGYDSITSADAGAESYRQIPQMIAGKISIEEGLKLIQEKNVAVGATETEE
ncbi:ABC transporter substrate-binding protein [Massiliimalia timonensis]|uniref:ABC transporter substrate-binding protein n=1 Tax=Massiliimalia timonensis TaxID=1987501 RepID=UPI00189EE4BA|nr:extracellular solute-binding protein [Massiliimalia timonensis]